VGDFDPATGGGFSSGHPGIGEALLQRTVKDREYWLNMLLKWSLAAIASVIMADIIFFLNQKKAGGPLDRILLERKPWTAAILSFLAILLSYCVLNDGHNWGGDFSQYISQAISIDKGSVQQQIQSNEFIIQNSPLGLGPTVYPWGTPLLLVPVYWLFGFNLFAFKLPGVLSFGIFVVIIFYYYSNKFRTPYAVFLTLLFSVNSSFILFTNNILSDIHFLLFSTISIVYLQKLLSEKSTKKQLIFGFIFGFSSAVSFQFRTNGIVLIITLFCFHVLLILACFFQKSKFLKKASNNISKPYLPAHAAPYLIFILFSIAIAAFLPGGGESHFDYISKISIRTMLSNIVYYSKLMSSFFPFPMLSSAFYAASLICFLVGLKKKFIEELPVIIYSTGTMVLLILWPATQGLRFLFPIIPFYILFSAYGGKALLSKLPLIFKRLANFLLIYICALMLVTSSISAYRNLSQNRLTDNGAFSSDAVETYEYIRKNTLDSDVIVFRKPRVLWLTTNRLGFSLGKDQSKLRVADYILFSNDFDNRDSMNDVMEKNKNTIQLDQVFTNSRFRLYRIIHAEE